MPYYYVMRHDCIIEKASPWVINISVSMVQDAYMNAAPVQGMGARASSSRRWRHTTARGIPSFSRSWRPERFSRIIKMIE